MDKDTFTMEDVEALQLEGAPETTDETAGEAKKEEPASFLDSFKKAKGEAEGTLEPEAAREEPEPEASEVDESTPESRSASDFKLIKSERDDARKKMIELEAKLKDAADSDTGDLLKEAQDENRTLSEQLRISSIERHPEFIKKYDTKIGQIVSNAQATVGEHNARRIQELLLMEDNDMRNEGIEQIFSELSPANTAKLGAFLAQVDNVKAERVAALVNHEDSYNALRANEDARHDAHLAKSNELFDKVLAEATGNLEIYKPREGEDEWNGEVSERINQARQIFCGESNATQMARASLWAAAGPMYRDLLIKQSELNRRLQSQVSGGDSANPTLGGTEATEGVDSKSFMEVFGEHSGMDVSS
jgi:hypothetical protein